MKKVFNFSLRKKHSKAFLLLEIGTISVRLHHIETKSDQRKANLLCEVPLLPGDASLQLEAVRSVLDACTSTTRDLVIVSSSPIIRHQIICIPPLRRADRNNVLIKEMKRLSSSGEAPGIVSFWSAATIKEHGTTKEYVLCAEMPRANIEALSSAIKEKQFNLIGFTSHAQMVCHLMEECRQNENPNIALLEVNEHEGAVTLFHSNIWSMERNFLISNPNAHPDTGAFSALEIEKVKLEVGRALQYFKQQVRNENISRIALYGATRYQNEISQILETAFRIPVITIALDEKRFKAPEKDGGQAADQSLFGIQHVAALHSQFQDYIDFLPPEWGQEKQILTRRMAIAGVAISLYIGLGCVAYMFRQEASKVAAQNATPIQQQIRPAEADPTDKIQASRSFAFAAEQSTEWMQRKHNILADLARKLAAAAPREMRITALEAAAKNDTWQVSFQAEILSSSGSRSQQLFLQFQERMNQASDMKQLKWDEVHLLDSGSLPPEASEKAISSQQNQLTFTMQGILSVPSP